MRNSNPQAESPLDIPLLPPRQFVKLVHDVLRNPNLGAGMAVSGTSGSGKSNFAEWTAIESLKLGIPLIHIDPHGTSARKIWRMSRQLPQRMRDKILYWRVGDPEHVASINPLAHDPREADLSEYERLSKGRIQVELTSEIILAAVSEGGQGFGNRPVLRKWITRWLWMLWSAGLTLADASLLIDPHHPCYPLMMQLAPDAMSRLQMEELPGLKVSELESEIGSGRNRIASILDHPAAVALFSRRHHTIDFRYIYENDLTLLIDLDTGGILSDEVQRLMCVVVLTTYLSVVLSTPEDQRRRRLCMIDELPVFAQAKGVGPLLERMCTEIRKYLTSFVFLFQGAARFEGRTDNEFLQTILGMCRFKLFFREEMDADWFAKMISLKAHQGPRIKHVLKTPQQFNEGNELVELMDRSENEQQMTGSTTTEGHSDQSTNTITQAVYNADQRTNADGQSQGQTQTQAQQQTHTTSQGVTYKQTLVPKLVTKNIVSSVQFYSREEIDFDAAARLAGQDTGEAIGIVGGQGVFCTKTPEAKEPFAHAPKFGARKMAEWRREMLAREEFAAPEQIQREREQFLATLMDELRTLSYQSSARRLDQHPSSIIQTPPPRCLELPDAEDPQITF